MHTRQIMRAAVTAALLIGPLGAAAAPQKAQEGKGSPAASYYDYSDMPDTESAAGMKASIDAALETHRARMRQAPKEVADGLRYTEEALQTLQRGDDKGAERKLEAAMQLFRIALTNNPALDDVPVADGVSFEEMSGTSAELSKRLKAAESAIEAHRTQDARALLMPMEDQMTLVTEALPMALYPDAIKLSLAQLKKGHRRAALQTLQGAFSMLVTEEEVLPLPLLRARAFSDAASGLEKGRQKQASALIARAQDELQKAVLLGYSRADDADYKRIEEKLAAVKKSVDGANGSGHFFEALAHSFEALLKRAESDLHKTASAVTGS